MLAHDQSSDLSWSTFAFTVSRGHASPRLVFGTAPAAFSYSYRIVPTKKLRLQEVTSACHPAELELHQLLCLQGMVLVRLLIARVPAEFQEPRQRMVAGGS